MKWFTMSEFKTKYIEYDGIDIPSYKIDWVCEMIFSKIGLRYRQYWDVKNVPFPIKEASMDALLDAVDAKFEVKKEETATDSE